MENVLQKNQKFTRLWTIEEDTNTITEMVLLNEVLVEEKEAVQDKWLHKRKDRIQRFLDDWNVYKGKRRVVKNASKE